MSSTAHPPVPPPRPPTPAERREPDRAPLWTRIADAVRLAHRSRVPF
jgi:hypothetical protein